MVVVAHCCVYDERVELGDFFRSCSNGVICEIQSYGLDISGERGGAVRVALMTVVSADLDGCFTSSKPIPSDAPMTAIIGAIGSRGELMLTERKWSG
jgi:hypothetical protein